jgi:dCTP diphosphatase
VPVHGSWLGPQTLRELQALLRRFRDERDWAQFHTLKDLAAAICVEAGELTEHLLWLATSEEAEVLRKRRDAITSELADVVIQCLNFANAAELDLAEAILAKVAVNAERYPIDKVRGRATKYTDL